MQSFPFKLIFIIGAPRSGTNALRNALCSVHHLGTWPCDEINPVWRHKNMDYRYDDIPLSRATPAVINYLRSFFFASWKSLGQPSVLVEKTCSNCLRVPFIQHIFPEAYFIHLVRHPYSVIPSAVRRWRGEFELNSLSYYLAKARFAPLSDLPNYAFKALTNKLSVRFGLSSNLGTWGPVASFEPFPADLPVEDKAALQWTSCVNSSLDSLQLLGSRRLFVLRYEDLTSRPLEYFSAISDKFELNLTTSEQMCQSSIIYPSSSSINYSPTESVRLAISKPSSRLGYSLY